MISNMITPRSGAGCAALNYRIFVCGGRILKRKVFFTKIKIQSYKNF